MIINRDNTFKVVCNIRTPKENGEIVGTGFFISKGQKVYLVTATHVAVETNNHTYIVYCDDKSNAYTRLLCLLNNNLNWINHKVQDISVLEVDVSNNIDWLIERCFPYDYILSKTTFISRDDELTCVGFLRD